MFISGPCLFGLFFTRWVHSTVLDLCFSRHWDPTSSQHVGNQNNPSFWPLRNFPPSQAFLFHFSLVTSRRVEKKDTTKDLSESKMRDCSKVIECISLSKKSTRASRGGGKFFYWKHGQNWRHQHHHNTARIPRKVTQQPHQLLSYCTCHAICQCQPISYTLPAATLFWVTLLWATPPSLFVLFISKSWFWKISRTQEFLN